MKKEAETGGDSPILGSLDIKDAFLQVDQEVPTQVSTSSGHLQFSRTPQAKELEQRLGSTT